MEAERLPDACFEVVEAADVGFLDQPVSADDPVEFVNCLPHDLRFVHHLRKRPLHCIRWVVHGGDHYILHVVTVSVLHVECLYCTCRCFFWYISISVLYIY